MASIEEKLKQYIKDHFGSVRAFVLAKDLNYANVDSILRRGIKNTTWNNVKTLCNALEISADELAEDRIIPVEKTTNVVRLESVFETVKQQILSGSDLTINGQLSRFMDLYGLGRYSIEDLDAKTQPLLDQRQKLQQELNRLHAISKHMTEDQALQLVNSFADALDNSDQQEKKRIIHLLIDKIIIDGNNITIHWNFT